jgi:23S rRNA (guanosine2251-2'-O)-methyltransferase
MYPGKPMAHPRKAAARQRNNRSHQHSHTPQRHHRPREGGSERSNATPVGDFVMGRNCLAEVLKHSPDRILEVYVAEARDDGGRAVGDRRGELIEQCRDSGIEVRQMSRRDLDALVHSDSHQGFVARVRPRQVLQLDELVELVREQPFARILALDGVLDPQNSGAILRAAECFGVDAVLWSRNRAAPVGPVVSKVSVGASELVPLCPVSNLHRALEALKGAGAWLVGAMVAPDATTLDRFEFPEKSVLVMGSEGEGVQHLIQESLDFRVYIPMLGVVSSLNVSQATTVMLHELAKQHRQTGEVKVT